MMISAVFLMLTRSLEGYVYSIAATDAKLEFTVLTKEAYFSGNFFVYYEGERIGFTPVKTKIDNEDGTYTLIVRKVEDED